MLTKETLFSYLDEKKDEIYRWGAAFFACPELGFHEFVTAEKICDFLEEWKIPYEKGLAQTGVIATLGKADADYHIAFVADMDALPSKTGSGFIHACGHSIQVTIALAVLYALQKSDMVEKCQCKVSFFFTPAEEFIDFFYRDGLIAQGKLEYRSGKQNMIAMGCFDGVDCVLSAHVNGETDYRFDIGSTLTGFLAKEITFLGRAAHSGAAAHQGRNTLHGAMLTMNAVAFLKEQYDPSKGLRLSPILAEGGGSVNIIPEKTVIETYVRANDNETLFDASRRLDCCAKHCAAALELECGIKDTAGYLPLVQSKPLNRLVKANMLLLCKEEAILENPVSGASGDVGDISFLLPTIQFGFSGTEGQIHNDNFTIQDEENCYIASSKVVLGTMYDLLTEKKNRIRQDGYEERKAVYLNRLREKNGEKCQ